MNILVFYHTSPLPFWLFQRNVNFVHQVLVGYILFLPSLVVSGFLPDVIKVNHFLRCFGTNLFAHVSKVFPIMQQAPFENPNFVRTPFFDYRRSSQRAFHESQQGYFLDRILPLLGIVPVRVKLRRWVHHGSNQVCIVLCHLVHFLLN